MLFGAMVAWFSVACDTMVATPAFTRSGMLFAKNSDRPVGEAQPLAQELRRQYPPGTSVPACCVAPGKCLLQIPQANETFRHVGSRPIWCAGYEADANEFSVVIGNEAWTSVLPPSDKPVLVGMELLRFGLERARTARAALNEMTRLVTNFGQGCCAGCPAAASYDNIYLIADAKEAFVLLAAGHEWAWKKVTTGFLSISNVGQVGAEADGLSPTAHATAIKLGLWNGSGSFPGFAEVYGTTKYRFCPTESSPV